MYERGELYVTISWVLTDRESIGADWPRRQYLQQAILLLLSQVAEEEFKG